MSNFQRMSITKNEIPRKFEIFEDIGFKPKNQRQQSYFSL